MRRTSSSVQIKCTYIYIWLIVLNINDKTPAYFYIKSPLTASRAVSRTIISNQMHWLVYMWYFVSFDLLVVIKKTYLLNVSTIIMDDDEYIWIGANQRPPFSLMAVTIK